MTPPATDLVLIRHAPAETGGRLCGRTDVGAAIADPAALARMGAGLGPLARLVTSPARRCRETAAALFPGRAAETDPRLWEQDFGAEDGMPLAALPDLGPLSREALAARRPPGGESFDDMAARMAPALAALAAEGGTVAVVAHAGTVRAGLALALRTVPAALALAVAPLSATWLRRSAGGWSVDGVSRPL